MDKKVLDLLKERGISEQDYQDMLDNTGLDIEPVEEKPLEIEPIDPLINYAEPISLKQPSLQKEPTISTPTPSVLENQEAFEVGTIKNYEEALKKAKEERAISRLAQSGNKLGSAIGGLISGQKAASVDDESYKAEQEEAFEPVKELQSKIQLQDTDPNSAKSKAYRDYLKKIGFPVSENASYATLKGLLPEASRHFDRQLEREFKQQENALRRAELGQRKEEIKQAKFDDRQNRWIEKVTPQVSRLSEALDSSNRAKETALRAKKGTAAELSVLYDYIRELDKNSAVREGEVNLAKSLSSFATKLKFETEKLGKDGILPERTFEAIKQETLQLAKSVEDVYKRKVAVYHNQAKAYGLNEEDFNRFDPYYEEFKKLDQKDPKIEAYAKQYDLSYEKAEDIIRKRRYERK